MGLSNFLNKDIYHVIPESDLGTHFDLIILKDVIEHIPDQARFMPQLERFLKPGGKVFLHFHLGKCLMVGISRFCLKNGLQSYRITICYLENGIHWC